MNEVALFNSSLPIASPLPDTMPKIKPLEAKLISWYGVGFAVMQTLLLLIFNLYVIPFILLGTFFALLGGVSIWTLVALFAVIGIGLLVLLIDAMLTVLVVCYALLYRPAVYGMILFSVIMAVVLACVLPTIPVNGPPVVYMIRTVMWIAPVYYLPSIIIGLMGFKFFDNDTNT